MSPELNLPSAPRLPPAEPRIQPVNSPNPNGTKRFFSVVLKCVGTNELTPPSPYSSMVFIRLMRIVIDKK